MRRDELDEAVAHYETAMRLKPDDAEAHYNLARARLKKNEVDATIAHYRRRCRSTLIMSMRIIISAMRSRITSARSNSSRSLARR